MANGRQPNRRRKKRFRMQPRFFLVIFILAAVAVAVVFLIKKINTDETEDPDASPSPVPTATAAPTMTPKPSLPPNVTVVRDAAADPGQLGIRGEIMVNGRELSDYSRENAISFGRDVEYSALPGVLTFGGNSYRNSFSYGTPIIKEKRLREKWSMSLGAIGNWSGTGWTGMPLIVQWPDETRQVMNVAESYKTAETSLTEVIYPAMDGNIYFVDLETGKKTREAIVTGIVQKGTACIDPRGYPLLFVGQGIPVENEQGNSAAQVRVYSLLTQEQIYAFGGFDYFSERIWQAYDSSPMIVNDTIVYGGENGVLYSAKLNAAYDPATATVALEPERLVKLRYSGSGYSKKDAPDARWYGIESSVAAFRNFGFFTDNGGRLLCVDLNNLTIKYAVDVTDESDSTVVIEENYDDNTVYLYTGSMVKFSDSRLGAGYGYSYQRKINGLTGKVMWERMQICSTGDGSTSGGMVATPHVGKVGSSISNLVIYPLSMAALTGGGSNASQVGGSAQVGSGAAVGETSQVGDASESPAPDAAAEATPEPTPATEAQPVPNADGTYNLGGRIVAYDKTSGAVAWTVEQSDDYWASPVVLYDERGSAYMLQCDRGGKITMYDARDGSILTSIDLGSRIDSTPAVFGNYLVVGTRGKGGSGKSARICCVEIS